ncbi:MAG: hypothetical protein EBS85_06680 [Micrococcales bacterium]|nr:hypothetical protein [Micrococcales bacterium]
MPTVLAFDIGIRNLAWCLATKTEDKYTVLGWQNYDLLRGEGNETAVATTTCASCSAKAVYFHGETKTCVRHCPAAHPAIRDLSGALLKKLPSMAGLKEILASKGVKASSKAVAEEKLATFYSLPIPKVKVTKALDTELTTLHDAIRKFVGDHSALFRTANTILLENQPVLKVDLKVESAIDAKELAKDPSLLAGGSVPVFLDTNTDQVKINVPVMGKDFPGYEDLVARILAN